MASTKRGVRLESADYFMPDTYANRERVRMKTEKHMIYSEAIHWSLAFIVGVVTGLLTSIIHVSYHKVADTRLDLTLSVIESSQSDESSPQSNGNLFAGFVIHLLTMMGLVFIAFRLVYWAPGAYRTGIPDVLAYLNGVKIPRLFDWQTLIAKVIGVVCAVASGLATGPEGPLIHIGGIIGSLSVKVYKYILIVFGGHGLSWEGIQTGASRAARAAMNTVRDNARQVVDSVQYTVSYITPGLVSRPDADTRPSAASLNNRRESRISLNNETILQPQPQDHRTALSWDMVLDEESDDRDYVAIGAGCGVAAAFSAPVGGILFIVEEASSFFNIQVVWKGFFACVIAYWFAYLVDFADHASLTSISGGRIGGTGFLQMCQTSPLNLSDIILFVVIGIVGGLLGALFNWACSNVARIRRDYIDPYPYRRYGEILLLCVATSFVACVVPAAFECVDLKSDIFLSDTTMCQPSNYFDQIFSAVKHIPGEGLNATYFTDKDECTRITMYPSSILDELAELELQVGKGEDASAEYSPDLFNEAHPPPVVQNHLLVPYSGAYSFTLDVHSQTVKRYLCDPGKYNPFASLVLQPAATVVRTLFSKGNTNLYPAHVILIFVIIYFVLAVWTAGHAIPTGLFVPQMVIGGSFGRLFGLLDVIYEKWDCTRNGNWVYLPDLASLFYPNNMMPVPDVVTGTQCLEFCPTITDPGIFAIVGAASFMGGSGRITLFLAVVTMEITRDISLMTPITIGLLLAVWVGNLFNAGIYHELIHVKGLPFLYHETDLKHGKATAKVAMSSPVVTLPRYSEIRHIRSLLTLRKESYNCFPVVVSVEDPRLLGSMLRNQLQELLDQLDRSYRQLRQSNDEAAEEIQDLDSQILDLVEYMDLSPISIYENFSLSRAYRIFRSEALRHMFVIDSHNRIVGIISRKDLMPWAIPDLLPHHGDDHVDGMDDFHPGEEEFDEDDDVMRHDADDVDADVGGAGGTDLELGALRSHLRDSHHHHHHHHHHHNSQNAAGSSLSTSTAATGAVASSVAVAGDGAAGSSDFRSLPEQPNIRMNPDYHDNYDSAKNDDDDDANNGVEDLNDDDTEPIDRKPAKPFLSGPVQYLKDTISKLRNRDEHGHRFSVPNIVEDVVPWQSAEAGLNKSTSDVVFENEDV